MDELRVNAMVGITTVGQPIPYEVTADRRASLTIYQMPRFDSIVSLAKSFDSLARSALPQIILCNDSFFLLPLLPFFFSHTLLKASG